jgi:hypothetical protein
VQLLRALDMLLSSFLSTLDNAFLVLLVGLVRSLIAPGATKSLRVEGVGRNVYM